MLDKETVDRGIEEAAHRNPDQHDSIQLQNERRGLRNSEEE
jgi:hypothetical protein